MFTIITKPDCPWCDKAKSLMRMREESFSEFSVAEHPILRDFLKSGDLHTVPQVYWKGERIGGYEDLEAWFQWEDGRRQFEEKYG